ncbi:Fc receptor-like protein 4 isoform X2 [Phascolarctos cinereus]|uniref:Fc receptor-like protein 4 isoform X2 n=1 Tax=Phascolarctos cinereus TaxID=38626 RepID=A0A6P5KN89_PHACI|nr:Fc receptor-like protein 4 isoform X2 [Phascolarctos cinereus]
MDPLFMLALALVSGQAAFSLKPRPVIYIDPPWTAFFKGERVLLTCNGLQFYAPGKTKWYHKGRMLQETPGNNIIVNNSGPYKCKTSNSPLSDSVDFIFCTVSLILRIPYLVFEGDSLLLRCQEKDNKTLTRVTYYKNGKPFSAFNQSSDVFIPQANLSNSGLFYCTAFKHISWKIVSSPVNLHIRELFSRPVLKTTDSQPIEGSLVTLRCEIWIPPEKSSIQLLFSFFRDPGVILLGQARAQELQISKFWREDSGPYWCEVETVSSRVCKQSQRIMMSARRIPISGVHMEVQPHGGHVMEGQKLVLLCSVVEGSGAITFSWHREGTEAILGKKTLRSMVAEFVFSAVKESDAGKYYCTADHNSSLIPSHSVSITVRRNGRGPLVAGITTPLVSALGLTAIALLVYFKLRRKSGENSSTDLARSPPIQISQEIMESNAPTCLELQEIHSDETPVIGDVVYSEVWSTQQGKEGTDASGKPPDDNDNSIIYSVVKKEEAQLGIPSL